MSEPHSQFQLLKERRFAPFFWTQFFGAFNDNVYKNAAILLMTFHAAQLGLTGSFLNKDSIAQIGGALFILPFLLFSATCGQLADKYEKTRIIRLVKLLEIGIMALGGVGFWLNSVALLLAAVFLLGLHSTIFGPVKYAILPQQLREDELMGGNGLVEMGTFIAILLGEILGAYLIGIKPNGWMMVSGAAVAFAVVGYLISRRIPAAPATAPELKINWNPLTETISNVKLAGRNKRVLIGLLAASWFWFVGAVVLSQLLTLGPVLKGSEQVATVLLAVFSIGVGIGSVLCEKLSGHRVEIGLVPLGALGITVSGLYFAVALALFDTPAATVGAAGFLARDGSLHILAGLGLLGFFGGLFIVPLYALMQAETEPEYRSRIIASNNIINALFVILSAVFCMALLSVLKLTIPQLIGATALLNLAVCGLLFGALPDFIRDFRLWLPRFLGLKSA